MIPKKPGTQKAQERVELQRDRILAAARQCFIVHGFHGASMATIADTAQMSAGLIYRYFESKSAIILAIIERQLQETRADLATLQSDTDLASRIAGIFRLWQTGDGRMMNPSLFLEMSAEASRDPQIALALGESDRVVRAGFIDWLRGVARAAGHHPVDADLQARAIFLQCLIEGLALRAVREPDLDPAEVERCLREVLPSMIDFGA